MNSKISKTLVVAVILLFIGVGIQPAIATVQQEGELDANLKEYFLKKFNELETNSTVNGLLEQYEILEITKLLNTPDKESLNGFNEFLKNIIAFFLSVVTVIFFSIAVCIGPILFLLLEILLMLIRGPPHEIVNTI